MVSSIIYANEVSSYDAILFDFDGVLVDSEPVHFDCWREVLEPFGIASTGKSIAHVSSAFPTWP